MRDYRVLLVENLKSGANLMKLEIEKVLEKFEIIIVKTRQDLIEQLEKFIPDLVITAFKLPSFDGLTVLQLTKEKSPHIPVIFLTTSINEDAAVECMKAGAADYITKEHIKQLGKAMITALKDS